MKNYSVLLLYPDYLAENYGQDTYYAFVDAETPEIAVRRAQAEAVTVNPETQDEGDFFPLLCIEGFHDDLRPRVC